jgi:predicted DCC family thiol-disulfide oxidoreductase YuxK
LAGKWRPRAVCDIPDGLILFDGVCILCSWRVRFVIERDVSAQFRFAPIQSSYGRALAERLGIDFENPETNAVIVGGRAYFKSDAAIRVLGRLPRWSWSGVFGLVPRMLRDWVYDRVARNRHRFFGRTESCLVPTPEIARRFMFDNPLTQRWANASRGRHNTVVR